MIYVFFFFFAWSRVFCVYCMIYYELHIVRAGCLWSYNNVRVRLTQHQQRRDLYRCFFKVRSTKILNHKVPSFFPSDAEHFVFFMSAFVPSNSGGNTYFYIDVQCMYIHTFTATAAESRLDVFSAFTSNTDHKCERDTDTRIILIYTIRVQ
jgi:hypothetical protein